MIEFLNTVIGAATPIAVLLTGGAFALGLRGLPFTRPRLCVRAVGRAMGSGRSGTSPFRSLALALAGTLGVGNIVGVTSAIALGGAGAVFWMWVSALFATFLKYAEVVLALVHRENLANGSHRGGAPYYIRARLTRVGLVRLAPLAALLFALLCLVNALLMGCMLQTNAVARAMSDCFSLPPLVSGVALALACLILLTRGGRAVSAATSVLVPLMSAVFLALSLAALWIRREALPIAFANILREAFSPLAAGGGILGFLTSRALRMGTIRGIISNEAGCGTSPTAHAASDAKSPVEQGLFGILEVMVDTLVLCTVTALVTLVSQDGSSLSAQDPLSATLSAYSAAFGGATWVKALLALCILCFGFATLLCWAHYGMEAFRFLTSHKKNAPPHGRTSLFFCFAFGLFAVAGAVSAPNLVWSLTDLITGIMTLLNCAVLLLSLQEIKRQTTTYFGKNRKL